MDDRLPGIRPRPSLLRRLDMLARRGFPGTLTAILLLLAASPLGIPGQPQMQMAVALCCVFFWSVFRPASMPPWMVFLLGLLTDLIGFVPVGVGVLLLLAVHGLALRWRRLLTRQGFVAVWIVLTLLGFGAALLQWALISLLTFRLLPIGPALFLAVLIAGAYPLLAVPLTRAHRTLAEPEAA